jgi:hypothetical protein
VSDKSCCSSTFKITCNSTLICGHVNNIYIWAYTVVSCHFWIATIKNNNFLLVFTNIAKRDFSLLDPMEKLFLVRSKKNFGPPWSNTQLVRGLQHWPTATSDANSPHSFHAPLRPHVLVLISYLYFEHTCVKIWVTLQYYMRFEASRLWKCQCSSSVL